MTSHDELRELLGLGLDDELVETKDFSSPSTAVAEGYVDREDSSHLAGLSTQLLRMVENEPHATPDLAMKAELASGGQVSRWDHDPRVLIFEGIAAPRVVAGRVDLLDNLWVMDTRHQRAVMQLGGDREQVLEGVEGRVRLLAIKRSQAAPKPEPRTFEPAELLELTVPTPADLLKDVTTAEWLLKRARDLHDSPVLLDRVASAGLLARLSAGESTNAEETLKALLDGVESVADRVAAWAKELSKKAQTDIELLLLEEAGELGDAIAALGEALGDTIGAALELARSLCYRRDDLEAVAYVLRRAGETERVMDALTAVDTIARVNLTSFDLAGDLSDDRLLRSVGWQQPEAWWGISE